MRVPPAPKPTREQAERIDATRAAAWRAQEHTVRNPAECQAAVDAYLEACRAAGVAEPPADFRDWIRPSVANKTPLRDRITTTPTERNPR